MSRRGRITIRVADEAKPFLRACLLMSWVAEVKVRAYCRHGYFWDDVGAALRRRFPAGRE